VASLYGLIVSQVVGFVKGFQKLFFKFSSSTSSVFATTGFLGLLPLDIVIVAHPVLFVKRFQKLFSSFFEPLPTLGLFPSVGKTIIAGIGIKSKW